MNLLVIGAGAIGMLLAAKLSKNDAMLVARTEEQARLIRQDGLTVSEVHGTLTTTTVRCSSTDAYASALRDSQLGQADCILLAVKQTSMDENLYALLRLALKADGIVVCYQNGIGHIEELTKHLGLSRVAIAVTTEGALTIAATRVAHTGRGTTKLGFLHFQQTVDERQVNSHLKVVQQCLNEAGFVTLLSNEITSDVWNKLVINSVINPLTAAYGLLNGELLTSPFLIRMMRCLYEDAISVATAEGVSTAPNLWELLLDVCRKTANNRSSMLQDVDAGRLTEIEWINGSLIRVAAKHSLHVPAQETMYKVICGSKNSR